MGYYNNYKKEVSTINLLKMHGSVNWSKSENQIRVSYENDLKHIKVIPNLDSTDFVTQLVSEIKNKNDLSSFNNALSKLTSSIETEINDFYEQYKELAIINPNKWKFHETVFEQHYYQIIRNFSYELENPNTVLIVFGFSFADEHIEETFKRSTSNPTLEIILFQRTRSYKVRR